MNDITENQPWVCLTPKSIIFTTTLYGLSLISLIEIWGGPLTFMMILQFQEARKCPDTTAGSDRPQNKRVMCVWDKTDLSLSPGWVYCPTCGNDSSSTCHLNLRRLLTDQLWKQTVKCIVFQSMLVLLAWPASVLHCHVPRHKPGKNWVLLQKLFKFSKTSQNPKCILVCTVYSWWTWFSIPLTCYPMNGQIYPKCPSPWAPWWVTLGSYLEKFSAQLWRGHWGREEVRKGEEMTPSSREGGSTALQTQILASALCSGNPRLVRSDHSGRWNLITQFGLNFFFSMNTSAANACH